MVSYNSIPLLEVVTIPSQSKTFTIANDSFSLNNQTCHLLFRDRLGLQRFFTDLDWTDCMLIECFEPFPVVLDKLSNLKSENVLNTLIVSNLSLLYWDMKTLTKDNFKQFGMKSYITPFEWYQRLNDTIDAIKKLYKCNVLVISYDNHFDRGYNFRNFETEVYSSLSSHSYLPSSYLLRFDKLVHFDNLSLRVFSKENKRWINMEPESLGSVEA